MSGLVFSFAKSQGPSGSGTAAAKPLMEGGMDSLLGRKGAGLARMSSLGLPVPPGFIISTAAQKTYEQSGLTSELKNEVRQAFQQLKNSWPNNKPALLVSVRSGAAVSMPGMMDSILNLGFNDQVAQNLAQQLSFDFAWGTYVRFIQMYAKVVHGLKAEVFQDAKGFNNLEGQAHEFKTIFQQHTGAEFPQTLEAQLWPAVEAVFKSWHSPRAKAYRRLHHLSNAGGTAVVVQAMVFGNLDAQSATGVAFTRNPATGEKQIYGEFLLNAQGEDIVSGAHTPEPLQKLQQLMPTAYAELEKLFVQLEQNYKDIQDVEFSIEQERVWLLQTRKAQRSLRASLKVAVDLVDEEVITREQALKRIDANQLVQLLHPQLKPSSQDVELARGLPASPGAAVGRIVLTAREAKKQSRKGEDVILVRFETSPEDIEGLAAAKGVLTACGGGTSHAAVVARGMGKPCIVGCKELDIDVQQSQLRIRASCASTRVEQATPEQAAPEQAAPAASTMTTLKAGDVISLDGRTGQVFLGAVETSVVDSGRPYNHIMQWAQQHRQSCRPVLGVRANADTPQDARAAVQQGAEGVGLCRTEHMFFAPQRLIEMQKLILATSLNERQQALKNLLPFQRDDFKALFQVMGDRPVCIRLLDPPLHEFLPRTEHELHNLAEALKLSPHVLQQRAQALREQNPMLGHRGCRLAFHAPEIYEMQVQAIDEAARMLAPLATGAHAASENNVAANNSSARRIEIMVPFVCDKKELVYIKNLIQKKIKEVCSIGAMIELPRAALLADEIAQEADFLSFGTNDLTQTVFGFSRDDVGRFLNFYTDRGYFADPFAVLDVKGVGQILKTAVQLARRAKPEIKLGVCGEHAGEAKSVHFFHQLGLDYISCSPHRLPIAKLAAAQ